MSCEKKAYVKFPFIIGYDCDENDNSCGGQISTECCEALLAGQENIVKLLSDIKKCVCDCGGVIPEPGYEGEAIGVILPESGRKADKTLYRVDKDVENIDSVYTSYFNKHPLWSGIVREVIDGQTMVKIPAFAYKRGVAASGSNVDKKYLLLAPADTTEPGFMRHPAFMKDGQPIDHFWVGAYQACLDPSDSNKLGSTADTMPLVNTALPTLRTKAQARNNATVSGFMVWSFYQLAAIQMLYLVEHANTDSRSAIGSGNNSGIVKKVDDPVVAMNSYRGMIGLCGNLTQVTDGVRTNAGSKTEIWRRDGFQNYVSTPFTLPAGLLRFMMSMESSSGVDYDFKDVFLPNAIVATAASAMYPDSYYGPVANAASFSCGYASESGMFTVNFSQAYTYTHPTVGTRVAKI